MPKTFIKKTGGWTEIKSIFVKKTTGWTEVKNVFLKKTVSSVATWVKVFTKLSLPDTTTSPSIRTTNTGSGTIYDGPVATSPQFLNANLYGKDGVYTNYTSIFGRKFTYGDTSSALTRSTLVTGDLFTSGGGVTTTDRTNLDNKYLFYELTVQNGSSANEIYPISSAIKMIKSYPALTDMGWTDAEQVGTQLSLSYTIENYYYNKIDPALSYVRWWRSSSTNAGGTLLKEETITATSTGATSTSRTGTSLYTPVSADIGYYIVAQITGRSSYTDHYGYTDNYAMGSFPTDGVMGSALVISNVSFTDSNGRSGKNARGNLVTATTTNLNWTVTGVNVDTTFRVRYRVLNNQTGLYYNPNDPTTALSAGNAWLSYTSNYYDVGTISSVSISGTTATIYDQFTIDSVFNGSTYGGGISKWSFEYELSVVNSSGTRTYWDYPNSMSTSQTNDYWDIDPTTDPSISASPSTIAPGGTVTFSGTFNPYPASLSSYPHSYRIVYGTSPATDSGWITLSSGTANQTYTNTKVYDTAGSYSAYIETTPSYTTNSASVTVSNVKVPPTIGTPTISAVGAFTAGQRRLSVPFTAVTNSGPAYQIYWYSSATAPGVLVTIDGSGTTSPILDATGPLTIGRWYAYIRSSATTTTSSSVAPSTTLSNWSDGAAFYVDGTRTLSYNKNTTDTVGSLPTATSGTDPWDGWVTTVSANTPTRTGFTFNGYNTASDATGTNYAASAAITLTSDVTLYAKWTANTYAINYYGNSNTGGSVPDAQTKTHGVDITLRTNVNTLTRTDFAFSGWNTNTSGTGTSYASGATYTGNAALDLYAKWSALYTITFDSKGGTAVSSIQQSSAGGSISQPTNPTKTDNSFGGWSTTDGGTTAVTWPRTPTGNETLYAIWTATATVPGAPSAGSISASTLTKSLTTSLTRNSNTQKDQYWSGDVKADFTMTWTNGTGATSHEIFYNDTGTTPSAGTAADYDDVAKPFSDYFYYSDTATTYHYWVRARNDNGTSAWVKIGTKAIPALAVTGYQIRIYRGNGTSYGTAANANAFADGFYAWTVQTRGNPSTGGEGHYAYIQATLNGGTGLTATSLTV